MSTYAHDNFESYSIGQTLPFGPFDKTGFGNGRIISDGWNGSSNALNLDQGVGLGTTLPGPSKNLNLGCYCIAGILFNFEQAAVFQCRNFAPLVGSRIICTCTVEIDGSISLYSIDDILMSNTGSPGVGVGSTLVPYSIAPFFVSSNEWFYLNLSFNFDAWLDGTIFRLTCGGTISINNTLYNTGAQKSTIAVAALPLPLAMTNQWNCEGFSGNGNKLDNIFVTDSGGFGEPYFPPDQIPVRTSQLSVEYGAINFPNRVIRNSQNVVEVHSHPRDRFIRASQLVVEVMGKGSAIVSDGMKVREI